MKLNEEIDQFGFEPTDPQGQAMTATDSNVVITAGPGSGKTLVLVGRMERLLAEGVSPHRIAAITFTNKAAVQMRQKLRSRLLKRWKQCQQLDLEGRARHWRSLVWGMDRIHMGTIHGFCTKLLRQYPHLVGLDPEFTVMDSYRRRILLEQTVEQTVREAQSGSDWFTDSGGDEIHLRKFIDQYGYSTHRKDSYKEMLRKIYLRGRSTGVSWKDLKKQTFASGKRLYEAAGGTANQWEQDEGNSGRLSSETVEQVRQIVKELLQKKDAHAVQRTTVYPPILEKLTEKWPQWKNQLDKESLQALEDLVDLLQKTYCPKAIKPLITKLHNLYDDVTSRSVLLDERHVLQSILVILEEISRRFADAKSSQSALDFADQQDLLLRLLRKHPEVQYKLSRRFSHLLIDEFQDTDGVQWELVRRLGTNSEDRDKSLFLVGDADQSIYRFRGADVEVYRDAQKHLKSADAQVISMTTNFRSTAGLLEIFNAGFSDIFDREVQLKKLDGHSQGSLERHPLEVLLVNREPADEDNKVLQGRAVAGWIEKWQAEGGNAGDVAVLVRSKSMLQPLAGELGRNNIPHRVIGGTGFYATREITDVRLLLKWLTDPTDDISLAGVLRSPFFSLSDEELLAISQCEGETLYQKLRTHAEQMEGNDEILRVVEQLKWWRRLACHLSVDRLLQTILQTSPYLEVTASWPNGEAAAANLDKLCDIASEMNEQDGVDTAEFARHLNTLIEVASDEGQAQIDPESADVVRVMTIHKAKGLEFPVVIVPGACTSRARSIKYPFILHPDRGLAVRMKYEGDCLHDSFKKWEKRAALQEERRIFYVACTRAENKLVLAGRGPKNPADFADGCFDDCLNTSGAEANSYVKWLGEGLCGTEAEQLVRWRLIDVSEREIIDGQKDQVAASADEVQDMRGDIPGVREALQAGIAQSVSPSGEAIHRGHSVTSLLDYQHCKRLYLLKHRLNWPEHSVLDLDWWRLSGKRGDGGVDPLILGTAVHRVCELIPGEELPAAIEVAMKESGLPTSIAAGKKMKKRVKELVQPYLESDVYSEIKEAHSRNSAYSEWAFSCPLQTQNSNHKFCRPYVVGKVDQLYQTDEGQWALVDFKSDEVEGEEIDRRVEHYSFQLQVYRWAAEQVLGIQFDRTGFYFLNPGEFIEVDEDYPVDGDMEERLLKMVEGIELGDEHTCYPPNRSDFCRWCGYRFHCIGDGEDPREE